MKKTLLMIFLLLGLCACNTNNKKDSGVLIINEMDYDIKQIASIDYQATSTDVITESLVGNTIYGSVVDFQKNAVTFITKELFSLTGEKLEIIKWNKDVRVYDQIKIDDTLYYLTYVVNGMKQYSELYQYKDGINDTLIQKFDCKERLNPPRFLKYDSTFIVLNNNIDSLCTYKFDKENHKLIKHDTLLNGDFIGISTAQLLDNNLYIDVAQGTEKKIYNINLQNNEVKQISNSDWYNKFIITKDFIVLYIENKELIYDKEFQLLRTNQIDTDIVTWIAYAKENNAVFVAEDKSIYYRTYDNNECLKLDSNREPIIQDFPIKIFVNNDTIISDNLRGKIYSIKIKNIK